MNRPELPRDIDRRGGRQERPPHKAPSGRQESVAESSGRFAYDGLDRVIHEKARLGIITSLAAHPEGLVFADLKELCALTDGNLSRHLHVLEEATLIEIWKKTRGNRPQTLVRLTEPGRQRFLEYIEELERVVADASQAVPAEPGTAADKRFGAGWSPA